jgi:hypothetical protein
MSGTNESEDRAHGKMSEMAVHAAETTVGNRKIKALITPLVEVQEKPEALTTKRVDLQDPTSPY